MWYFKFSHRSKVVCYKGKFFQSTFKGNLVLQNICKWLLLYLQQKESVDLCANQKLQFNSINTVYISNTSKHINRVQFILNHDETL